MRSFRGHSATLGRPGPLSSLDTQQSFIPQLSPQPSGLCQANGFSPRTQKCRGMASKGQAKRRPLHRQLASKSFPNPIGARPRSLFPIPCSALWRWSLSQFNTGTWRGNPAAFGRLTRGRVVMNVIPDLRSAARGHAVPLWRPFFPIRPIIYARYCPAKSIVTASSHRRKSIPRAAVCSLSVPMAGIAGSIARSTESRLSHSPSQLPAESSPGPLTSRILRWFAGHTPTPRSHDPTIFRAR